MWLARAAEERLEILQKQGHVQGSIYRSLGQEAGAVGAAYPLRRRADGSYRLTFAGRGAATTDVIADRVVLAIPPTTLREVDLSGAHLPAATQAAIDLQGMGSGVKFNLQFSSRPWKADGASGDAVSFPKLPKVSSQSW